MYDLTRKKVHHSQISWGNSTSVENNNPKFLKYMYLKKEQSYQKKGLNYNIITTFCVE